MIDERSEFFQDLKEKHFTARSARNRRGHTGKGGGMKTASDFMTKSELKSLHGECKTYRLGAPMSWSKFSEMPDDLKVEYIKKLRTRFNVPDEHLAMAMGVDILEFQVCLHKLSVKPVHAIMGNHDWYDTDDHGRFQTWWIISEEEK
jgi:hypothetical protein